MDAPENIKYLDESLKGALLHMLNACPALSAESLDRFSMLYGRIFQYNIGEHYASQYLIPDLMWQRKIFIVRDEIYSASSDIGYFNKEINNAFVEDSFWVYLSFLESYINSPKNHPDDILATIESTSRGEVPHAQITYIRRKTAFHIIRLDGNGDKEMPFFCTDEIARQMQRDKEKENAKKLNKETRKKFNYEIEIPNKYIFVFNNESEKDIFQYRFGSTVLYFVITWEPGKNIPKLEHSQPK